MTAVRLTQALRREVVRPLLRTKRELLRSICSVAPRHSGRATSDVRDPSVTSDPVSAAAPTATSPGSVKQDQATNRTKADLYEEAVRRNVPGRSTMNKAQLANALGLE